MDPEVPAFKEDIAFLRRITPNILPSNISASTINPGTSPSQKHPGNSTTGQPSSSYSLVVQKKAVNPDSTSQTLVTSQSLVSPANEQSPPAMTTRQSIENQSDSSLQSTRDQHSAAKEAKDDTRIARKRKEQGSEELNRQVQPKKFKTTSATNGNTNSCGRGGLSPSVVVQESNEGCSQNTRNNIESPSTNQSVSSIPGTSSPLSNSSNTPTGTRIIKLPPGVVLKPGDKIPNIKISGTNTKVVDQSALSTAGTSSPSSNSSTTPRGARVIQLPPGVKLKPGDKIQDILAAHKLSMETSECQQSQTASKPNTPTSQSTSTSESQPNRPTGIGGKPSGAAKSKKQKHSVVVIRPPSGDPDPKKVKILPPGTVTTSAFKSILLFRKYLMVKADSLYNRKFYQNQGEELQRRIEKSKLAENTKNTSAMYAGAMNETLAGTENFAVSKAAVQKAKRSREKNFVRHDALVKIRKTKEYKMLQRRFEALFAWPALLSTISPKNTDKSSEETNQETIMTVDAQTANVEETQEGTAQQFKKKVT